jgi:ubiquinone/menaquinone biosynthesis C-methylase UbiE
LQRAFLPHSGVSNMIMKSNKIYPDSSVEINPFLARYYDTVVNVASIGFYSSFMHKAIKTMNIQSDDFILDLGCGTGRNACIMKKYLGGNGKIIGMDVSSLMGRQFNKKCGRHQDVIFIRQRIDLPFVLEDKFDKIFTSFVIHGFPHEVRQTVIENAYSHLKPGGSFFMLDYGEFNINEMPLLSRFIFKNVECRYAFDFIERDWKQVLRQHNFSEFQEIALFKDYVRLLKASKSG